MQRSRGARLLVATVAAVLLGAPPALAGAAVSTGHSGWSWANPAPQGEDIADLAFSGSTGYAVGDFGTLLRSTDGGATWSGLPSTTVQDLTRIGLVSPAGFVTSGGCAVRRSTDTGTTLSAIDVGGGDTGCGTRVLATAFPDPSNGLILFQSGVVLGTTDGGVSLSRRTPVPGSPTDLAGVSATTAFATSGNAVYRTVDAGGSWTLVGQNLAGTPPTPRLLHALTFATPGVGYAAGDSGTVLKTTDGGATWLPVTSPGASLNLTGVRCADADLCLFTTSDGTIVRTPDGGATYARVTASASPIRAIAFASATRVVAAGDGGVTVLSDDGGVTWRTTSGAITGPATSIAAGAGGFAYAVGPTAISLTSDGGNTWRSIGIPTPRAITVAAFADPLTGYVQDDGDTLRRTLNGGASWQILDPGPAAGPLQGILTLSPTRLLLITRARVARSVERRRHRHAPLLPGPAPLEGDPGRRARRGRQGAACVHRGPGGPAGHHERRHYVEGGPPPAGRRSRPGHRQGGLHRPGRVLDPHDRLAPLPPRRGKVAGGDALGRGATPQRRRHRGDRPR